MQRVFVFKHSFQFFSMYYPSMPEGIENSKAVFKFNIVDFLAECCIAVVLNAG
jgi:hypothetical protein